MRSRILIQKRLHSIFFGTKVAKRKLPILKERGFDIASQVAHEGWGKTTAANEKGVLFTENNIGTAG
jgi:hypothetical protein